MKPSLLVLLTIICGIICSCGDRKDEKTILSTEKNIAISLKNKSDTIFLKAKIGGVAGNHEEISLSRTNGNRSDKNVDYIFYTSEVFYKIENDSAITLFAPESSINEPEVTMPGIIIKGLKNADEIDDYRLNYRKYNLNRISIY
jgi:hypothetical protein